MLGQSVACVVVMSRKGNPSAPCGGGTLAATPRRPFRPRTISSALSGSCGQIVFRANERGFLQFHALSDNVPEPLLGARLSMQSREKRRARRQIGGNGEYRCLGLPHTYRLSPGRIFIDLRDDKLIDFLFGQFLLESAFRAHIYHPVMIRTTFLGLSWIMILSLRPPIVVPIS